MPLNRERQLIMRATTARNGCRPAMRRSKRPQACRSSACAIRLPASSGSVVSACRNKSTSPAPSVAPKFIGAPRPRGAAMTRSAKAAARPGVPSAEPLSTTMTSAPRARNGASARRVGTMIAASLRTGTTMVSRRMMRSLEVDLAKVDLAKVDLAKVDLAKVDLAQESAYVRPGKSKLCRSMQYDYDGMTMTDPILVEMTRGALVESRHRGAIAVADANGKTVLAIGDVAVPVFPRSAIKAFQALPLVEQGAAERYGFGDEALALACASHSGEPAHVAGVERMLAAAGLNSSALRCGAHWPMSQSAAYALAKTGTASALHNNCSGKHAGFLCLACAMGIDHTDYWRPEHKVQREVRAVLEDFSGAVLSDDRRAIDG